MENQLNELASLGFKVMLYRQAGPALSESREWNCDVERIADDVGIKADCYAPTAAEAVEQAYSKVMKLARSGMPLPLLGGPASPTRHKAEEAEFAEGASPPSRPDRPASGLPNSFADEEIPF